LPIVATIARRGFRSKADDQRRESALFSQYISPSESSNREWCPGVQKCGSRARKQSWSNRWTTRLVPRGRTRRFSQLKPTRRAAGTVCWTRRRRPATGGVGRECGI